MGEEEEEEEIESGEAKTGVSKKEAGELNKIAGGDFGEGKEIDETKLRKAMDMLVKDAEVVTAAQMLRYGPSSQSAIASNPPAGR
jgi:hypothetical protein